jgi:pimeloyl-ACP methyl ester carboxylesterase
MIVRSLFAMLLVSCLGLREGFGAPPPSAPPPAWPYEHEARIAEPVFGGYAQLYQAGVGQARRIVLVHGIGDNGARDFEPLVPWLVAQGFHVLAFDLPGFGRSDKTNALYSPANYAAFVKFVADRYVRRPFVLLGHSMGAVVALRYSADHPEDVERLIVMNAPGILHRLSYSSQFLAHLGMTFLPSFMNPAGRIADFAHKLFGGWSAARSTRRRSSRARGCAPACSAAIRCRLPDWPWCWRISVRACPASRRRP